MLIDFKPVQLRQHSGVDGHTSLHYLERWNHVDGKGAATFDSLPYRES